MNVHTNNKSYAKIDCDYDRLPFNKFSAADPFHFDTGPDPFQSYTNPTPNLT